MLPKGEWWTIYNDSELNSYEDRVLAANQTLKAAAARFQEARAAARVPQAGLFPELDAGPSISRQRVSEYRPNLPSTAAAVPITQTAVTLPFMLDYELDLFGGVRNNIRSAQAVLQANAADLENAQLVLTSELAADYFQLRSLDAEIADVKEALDYEQKGLDLVQKRHEGGIASGLDVAQQKTVFGCGTNSTFSAAAAARSVPARVGRATGNPRSSVCCSGTTTGFVGA